MAPSAVGRGSTLVAVIIAHTLLIAAFLWRTHPAVQKPSEVPISIVELPAPSRASEPAPPRFQAPLKLAPQWVQAPEFSLPTIQVSLPPEIQQPTHVETRDVPILPPSAEPAKATPTDYAVQLAQRLAQVKRYPAAARMRRQQGTAILSFDLDRRGNVLRWSLSRSSGFDALDSEVRAMIGAVGSFPAFPDSMPQERESFAVPIEFKIADSR